jgi:hypothetical protein
MKIISQISAHKYINIVHMVMAYYFKTESHNMSGMTII